MTQEHPARPPIGVEPEFIWKEKRLYALVQAASRYIDAGRLVKPEWFSEMHGLISDLQINKSNNRRNHD